MLASLEMISSIFWERAYPYIVSTIVTVIWLWPLGSPFPAQIELLMGASVTVGSVFGGFLGASKAIILSIKSSAVFERLKSSGYLENLFDYLRTGVVAALAFIILSIIGYFIDSYKVIAYGITQIDVFSVLWIFAALMSLLSYYRVYNILFKLLRHT